MHFDVTVVADDALPIEHDFCFLRMPDRWVFVVKRSRAASPRVIREAWSVARRLVAADPSLIAAPASA